MPSERPASRLEDIKANAEAILDYTAGMDESAFEENRLVYDAVERCLERISEAAAKLGELAPVLVPDQPWRDIRALGNRLRHEYDDISQTHLWEIIQHDLPSLIADCERALQNMREKNG
ncbi:MAG: HepT-like ribonuclease domain-containing protein [Chloroflexia bacterium]